MTDRPTDDHCPTCGGVDTRFPVPYSMGTTACCDGWHDRPADVPPALWECPDCAFSFAAEHTDTATGEHSCPVCENARLAARIRATRPARRRLWSVIAAQDAELAECHAEILRLTAAGDALAVAARTYSTEKVAAAIAAWENR